MKLEDVDLSTEYGAILFSAIVEPGGWAFRKAVEEVIGERDYLRKVLEQERETGMRTP